GLLRRLQRLLHAGGHRLLELRTLQLPLPQPHEQRHRAPCQQCQQQALDVHLQPPAAATRSRQGWWDNRDSTLAGPAPMLLQKLLIVAFLIVIVYNLGAGLYYMLVDKGRTKRTVNSLTWRIGLSVALILLVILGIWTGVIEPHGIQG